MHRYRAIAAIVGATLLISGCTSNSSTTAPATSSASVVSSVTSSAAPSSSAPVSTAAPSSAPVSTPPASPTQSSKPTAASSKPTTASATVKISVPTTIASSSKADTAFAIAAYKGSLAVSDESYANPSKDWTKAIRTYEADPVAASDIASLKQSAAEGSYGSGHVGVDVTVTSVTAHKIVITGCVDTSKVKAFDKTGQSIKAPNQPGSYWRFPQTATLYKYALKDAPKTGGWLVSEVKSNLQKTC